MSAALDGRPYLAVTSPARPAISAHKRLTILTDASVGSCKSTGARNRTPSSWPHRQTVSVSWHTPSRKITRKDLGRGMGEGRRMRAPVSLTSRIVASRVKASGPKTIRQAKRQRCRDVRLRCAAPVRTGEVWAILAIWADSLASDLTRRRYPIDGRPYRRPPSTLVLTR